MRAPWCQSRKFGEAGELPATRRSTYPQIRDRQSRCRSDFGDSRRIRPMIESVAKFERLMNLVAYLLASGEPVPFSTIRKFIRDVVGIEVSRG